MATKYMKEFKTEAIRLGEREGVTAASEKLGLRAKTLCAWQRAARLEQGETPGGLHPGESVEQGFKRIEREVRALRDANCILAALSSRVRHFV